jgi:hypothetical protein
MGNHIHKYGTEDDVDLFGATQHPNNPQSGCGDLTEKYFYCSYFLRPHIPDLTLNAIKVPFSL